MKTLKKFLKATFAEDGRFIMILELLTFIVLAVGFFNFLAE